MALPPKLSARVQARLQALERSGLRRSLRAPAGIDLCSNDYLSLSKHPLLIDQMSKAVQSEGCGATASRLLRGDRAIFTDLEARFARFKNCPAALYFGSGYAANIGVLATFLEPEDLVFSDELNHASLIDGIRLSGAGRVIFPHNDLDGLAKLINSQNCAGQKFLVVESLFSMDGDQPRLVDYAALCQQTDTALIVDEAHAVGIYGQHGSGLIEAAGIADAVFLSINPCGKALGVGGAFVAGSDWAIDYLIQRARTLIFSTAPSPGWAGALDAALTVIANEPQRRQRLIELSRYLRELLLARDIPLLPGDSQIIPVMLGENDRAVACAQELQQAGFDVRAIRPPTVAPGTARLRLSVNVDLDQAILRQFADCLSRVLVNRLPAQTALAI